MAIKRTAGEIAEYLSGYVEGDPDVVLYRISSIENGEPGALSFLSNTSYEHYLYTTTCSAVLVDMTYEPTAPVHTTLIRVPSAYTALAQLLQLQQSARHPGKGIDATAFVHPTAIVDATAYVGPLAYIGAGAKIGAHTQILPHAHIAEDVTVGSHCTIYPMAMLCADTRIGDRCIIHSGAVLGADGFGFAPNSDGYEKIPQTGCVVLEDDVEVGANACIDRAVLDATIIRRGVKIDNLVQIGHNSEVREHTVIAAQSGVAGSTTIGAWNTLAGQVGVAGHLTTPDHTTLAAQTGVISSIKAPGVYFGSPAQPHLKAMKAAAKLMSLPDMDRELHQLKREVARLAAALEQRTGQQQTPEE